MKRIFLILPTLIAFQSCQQAKQLDDMHGATMEMNDSTKDMKETSSQMNMKLVKQLDVSEDLNEKMDGQLEASHNLDSKMSAQLESSKSLESGISTQIGLSQDLVTAINETYDALRQGNGAMLRKEYFDAMVRSKDLADKISLGTIYFMSFEFQLWNGTGLDSQVGQRDMLFREAVKEFFMRVQQFYVPGKIRPLAGEILSTDQMLAIRNFNALSVAMGEINRKGKDGASRSQQKPVTMLDLISEALANKEKRSSVTSSSSFDEEVLLNEDIAWQLLQSRHNTLSMVILSKLTDIKNPVNFVRKKTFNYNVDVNQLNPATQKLLSQYLAKTQQTISFLAANKRQAILDKEISSLWKHLRLINADNKDASTAALIKQINTYQAWVGK